MREGRAGSNGDRGKRLEESRASVPRRKHLKKCKLEAVALSRQPGMTVARPMRARGLCARRPRSFRVTTDSSHG